MIIDLGDDRYARRSYVICLADSVTQDILLSRAKARPGSYAGDLIANLHDAIFNRSLELKRDYTDYFELEYATFGEYLRKRFRFGPSAVKQLGDEYPRVREMIHFQSGFYFLEDDYGLEFLETLFEQGRTQ